MRRACRDHLVVIALSLCGAPLLAQEGPGSLTNAAAMVQVDQYWVDDSDAEPRGVTLRLTPFRPNRAVPTFGLGLAGGDVTTIGVAFSGEAGAGYLFGNRHAGLLLHGGVLGLLSSAFNEAAAGGYVGAAALLRLVGGFGGRLDVSRRYYWVEDSHPAWVFSAGLGVLPPLR